MNSRRGRRGLDRPRAVALSVAFSNGDSYQLSGIILDEAKPKTGPCRLAESNSRVSLGGFTPISRSRITQGHPNWHSPPLLPRPLQLVKDPTRTWRDSRRDPGP